MTRPSLIMDKTTSRSKSTDSSDSSSYTSESESANLDQELTPLNKSVTGSDSSSGSPAGNADDTFSDPPIGQGKGTNNPSKSSSETLSEEASVAHTNGTRSSSLESSGSEDEATSDQLIDDDQDTSNSSRNSSVYEEGSHHKNTTNLSSSDSSSTTSDTYFDQVIDEKQDASNISESSRATLNKKANLANPYSSSESESSVCAASRLFDELLEKHPHDSKNFISHFVPVIYHPDETPTKYRRLTARGREIVMREKLANSSLAKEKIDTYARAASYYPGTMYMPLNRAIPYAYTPPRISLSCSSNESSPNYLFKDLPATAKTPITTPKTPDRRTVTEACKTPNQSLLADVNQQLSPIFDRLKVRGKNRKPMESSKLSVTVVGQPESSKQDPVVARTKRPYQSM